MGFATSQIREAEVRAPIKSGEHQLLLSVRLPLAGVTEKEGFHMPISGITMDVFSGLMGLLGALVIFKWVRRRCEGTVLIDLHPVLVILALTVAFVLRTILSNLLVR